MILPYESFEHPDKTQNTKFLPYDDFHSELRNCNFVEAEETDYANQFKSGLTTEQAVNILKLQKRQPNGIEKYQNLQQK